MHLGSYAHTIDGVLVDVPVVTRPQFVSPTVKQRPKRDKRSLFIDALYERNYRLKHRNRDGTLYMEHPEGTHTVRIPLRGEPRILTERKPKPEHSIRTTATVRGNLAAWGY